MRTLSTAAPAAQTLGTVEYWLPMYGDVEHEISSLGRVRSLPRVIVTKAGVRRRLPGSLIKPWMNPERRLQVRVRGVPHRVHVLVLEAFVGPRPDGLVCCHNNGDPTDNRPENLRWDTRVANGLDAVRHGALWQTKVTHCPYGHPLSEPNLVLSARVRNNRICKACHRARAHKTYLEQKMGVEVDFQALSDEKYAVIMARAAA